MKKIDLAGVFRGAHGVIQKYSPEILTGIGIAGMITTTVLAVKATPKALMLIEEKKLDTNTDKLHPVDIVKTTWPCYIPPVVTGVMSIGCLIGASSVNIRRNAAIATAYALSETTLKEYRDKVVETIGEKKEIEVRDAIAKDKVDRHPVNPNEVIVTNAGDSLCFEPLSGRYFRSNVDKVKRAQNELNNMLLKNIHASLNDFYYEIGLDDTKTGDMLGWDIQVSGMTDIRFSTQMANNEPCLVIDFIVPPVYDYQKYY